VRGSTLDVSIVIPVFNEERTIKEIVAAVRAVGVHKEIVIVNDCSTDNTARSLEEIHAEFPEIRVIHHERNQGKGAALRTGFAAATCDIVAIQDADLEYDPRDLRKVIEPILAGEGGCGVWVAVCRRRVAPGAFLLALSRQSIPDVRLEHVHESEPDGYGDLLQGFPARGDSEGADPGGSLRV
jgi:glycosyltransferase involved in cell wall biosynthesis